MTKVVIGDATRSEFEKWVSNKGVAMHYEGDGHYGNRKVARWWEAWQELETLFKTPCDAKFEQQCTVCNRVEFLQKTLEEA